jgi:hypothetical protein
LTGEGEVLVLGGGPSPGDEVGVVPREAAAQLSSGGQLLEVLLLELYLKLSCCQTSA